LDNIAVGNTPAKLLSKFVPVHQSVAKILLLGCGDPRHILYTSWCIQQAGGLSMQQTLNVTMCDIEPSTIARNFLLYRLIHDDSCLRKAWSIFYERRIDDSSMSLLVKCAAELHSVGDSLETWHGTVFGRMFRFCDSSTYIVVRDIWATYLKGKVGREAESRMIASQSTELPGIIATAASQAQPCSIDAMRNIMVHSAIFMAYLKGPSPHYAGQLNSGQMSFNPTMFRGVDQGADLHYGLDPTCGYHISAAYLPSKSSSINAQNQSKCSTKVDQELIHSVCFNQFSDWCRAFKRSATDGKVVIQSFSGDMFDLSQALLYSRRNGFEKEGIIGNFAPRCIRILPEVPLEYDYIDTSNVSDHVGLLNVLLSCRELLCEGLNSTIATEFLCGSMEGGDRDVLLKTVLRTDLATFAAVTGLSLLDTASHLTSSYKNWSSFNVNPMMMGGKNSRTNIALEWKYIRAAGVRVHVLPADFVSIYTKIYDNMFQHAFSPPKLTASNGAEFAKAMKTEQSGQRGYAAPTVQTYVQLLLMGVAKLHSVESSTIAELLRSILNLRILGQMYYTSSLFSWLSVSGLLPPVALQGVTGGPRTRFENVPNSSDLCFAFPASSSMVLVTLLIPRAVMTDKLDKIDCPIVEMTVTAGGTENRFSSFNIQYVRDRICGAALREDCATETHVRYSNFDLVLGDARDYKFIACSTVVPVGVLEGEDVRVTLSIPYSTYMRSPVALKHFGTSDVVYSASLLDRTKVSRTDFNGDTVDRFSLKQDDSSSLRSDAEDLKNAESTALTAVVLDGYVDSYSLTINLGNTDYYKAGHMKMSTPNFEGSTMMCASIQLADGKRVQINLPVAVDVCRSNIRISRKQGYLAISIPRFKVSHFVPHILLRAVGGRNTSTDFSFIGTSRALLDSMRKMDVCADLTCIFNLISFQVSESESNANPLPDSVSMRKTIKAIVENFIGTSSDTKARSKFFSLRVGESGNDILLYVNCLRVNDDEGSVVIDAAVCVLQNGPNSIDPRSTSSFGKICMVSVTPGELVLWRKALPVLCERTRNDWTHTASCEYLSSRTMNVPVYGTLAGNRVVCSCCQGNGMQGTEFERDIGVDHRAYKHFFRAAISPLFTTFSFKI
jgi:Domain of unknown function (DUF4470)